MSTPYGQPQPPGWGQPPMTPPQQPNWFAKHPIITSIGGVILFLIVIGIATGDGETPAPAPAASAAPSASAPPEAKPAEEPKEEKSQADQFKDFIAEHGTAQQKAAAKHITDVQGAEKRNDVFDAAEIHTDYTGGLTGPNNGNGKLLANAFAQWKDSDNGLVTVYDANGEILANGNF